MIYGDINMPTYPIIQKNNLTCETAESLDLPTFYMEDFSVLGFRVNDCNQAEAVLGDKGFVLKRKKRSLSVAIEKAMQIKDVVQLLNKSGLECEIADVADGMYQG